ncbi:hypothetical protein, partial [Massilia genomosp. 1]|uniref:hypothetical protein n=1 Tax=Massilia genomosp. 1 TaxID=2609280 RepID=UPI001C9E8226
GREKGVRMPLRRAHLHRHHAGTEKTQASLSRLPLDCLPVWYRLHAVRRLGGIDHQVYWEICVIIKQLLSY